MSMTDEQINGLDEASRNTILQIVSPRLYMSVFSRTCPKDLTCRLCSRKQRAQAREAMSRR